MPFIEAADSQGVPVYLASTSDGKSSANPARMIHETGVTEKLVVANTSTPNAIAAVTIDPPPGMRADVLEVIFGYDGIPAGGGLQIVSSGQVTRQIPITNSGPGQLMAVMIGVVDTNIVVTLSAGGAGITGFLSASYRNI
jgi:hypothetical protein